MPRKPLLNKELSIAERVAALEAKVADVQRLAAAELARLREEYGDDLERVVELRREITAVTGENLGFLRYYNKRAPEPLQSLLQELAKLEGRARDKIQADDSAPGPRSRLVGRLLIPVGASRVRQ